MPIPTSKACTRSASACISVKIPVHFFPLINKSLGHLIAGSTCLYKVLMAIVTATATTSLPEFKKDNLIRLSISQVDEPLIYTGIEELALCISSFKRKMRYPNSIHLLSGADRIAFFAPASICLPTSSIERNRPVHSSTTSTPNSPHGNCAGSFSAYTFTR